MYPDVQRKAQAEIDTLIGSDRLPNFNDRHRLSYLDALLKEVHRWNPVAPIGGGLPKIAALDQLKYPVKLYPTVSWRTTCIWDTIYLQARLLSPIVGEPAKRICNLWP